MQIITSDDTRRLDPSPPAQLATGGMTLIETVVAHGLSNAGAGGDSWHLPVRMRSFDARSN